MRRMENGKRYNANNWLGLELSPLSVAINPSQTEQAWPSNHERIDSRTSFMYFGVLMLRLLNLV